MTKQKIEKDVERTILLNPGPATTSARVKTALIQEDICPREKEFGELLSKVREKCVRLVNGIGSHQAVLIPGPGTYSLESAVCALGAQGKKILILENGAYGARLQGICKAHTIDFDVIKLPWDEVFNASVVEDYLEKSKESYGALCLIHHETTSGLLNPLADFSTLAKRRGLKFFVDAMSSYAGLEIDLKKTPVDYLISSSNKCIQGMAGYGFVIVENDELERVISGPSLGFSLDLKNNAKNQIEKGEFLFTAPVQILYSLDEAFNEFFEEGAQRRFDRYRDMAIKMIDGMRSLGFKTLIKDNDFSFILTTFLEPTHPKFNFEDFHDFLYERGVTIYPGKIPVLNSFRVSNIGDLRESDIEFYIEKTAAYLERREIDELYV